MVGVQLLDRLGRQVTPTKAGELLYKHAVLLLDMKQTACLEMQEFMGIKRGSIRLGASTIPGEYILPKILGLFCREYPLISVNLSVADSVSIETRVSNGGLELGVIGSKTAKRNLICHELWADEFGGGRTVPTSMGGSGNDFRERPCWKSPSYFGNGGREPLRYSINISAPKARAE